MSTTIGAHHTEEVTAVQPTEEHFRKVIMTVNGVTANMTEVGGKTILRILEACEIMMTDIVPDGVTVLKENTGIRDDQDMEQTGIRVGIKTDIMMIGMSEEDLTMAGNRREI